MWCWDAAWVLIYEWLDLAHHCYYHVHCDIFLRYHVCSNILGIFIFYCMRLNQFLLISDAVLMSLDESTLWSYHIWNVILIILNTTKYPRFAYFIDAINWDSIMGSYRTISLYYLINGPLLNHPKEDWRDWNISLDLLYHKMIIS